MLLEGAKASIQLVREQAAKPDASSGLMDKLMTAMIDRMMNPPAPPPAADPIETFVKLQTILNKTPEATEREQKDPPIVEAMDLVEKMSGGRTFADLIKGKNPTVAPESAWAPFAPVALQFVTSLPTIMSEVRQTRQLEMQTKDLEFRRAVWLRTAQPGAQPPPELLANNPAPQNHAASPQSQPQPQTQPGNSDPMQLANVLVQMICHGFDKNPRMGYQTAATIDFTYGDAIEALGLEKFLADEAALVEYVQGMPALAERSRDARWAKFQSDFLDYTAERWPADEEPGAEGAEAMEKGPQSVA
jgi:hypothetical protein